MIVDLEATGVAATDTAALQEALDDLQVPVWETSAVWPVLRLEGDFYLNAPLTCNTPGMKTPCIDGQSATVLRWAGTTNVSTYMLNLGDPGTVQESGQFPVVTGVLFAGGWKTRVLRVHSMRKRPILRDVFFHTVREIGVDLIDCQECRVDNLYFTNTWGMSIRATNCPTMTYDHIIIDNSLACQHSTADPTANNTLWAYELTNGRAAAMAYYGANYVEYWPSATDTTVVDASGRYVQTPESGRAMWVHSGNHYAMRDVLCQSVRTVSYPLLLADASQGVIETFYSELNGCSSKICLSQKDKTSKARGYGRSATVRNFQHISDRFVSITPRSAIELRGRTYDVLIDGMTLRQHSHVVYASEGVHYGTTVQRLGTWPEMAAGDVISAVSPAQLRDTTTTQLHFASPFKRNALLLSG
jgi:hypothetical protein